MKKLTMTMAVTMVAASTASTLILMSSSSTSSSPAFLFQEIEERGDCFSDVVNHNNDLEDYGIWNPAPVYGGGSSAPIPHPQEKSK